MSSTVYEYNLDTPWDIRTVTFSKTGSTMYIHSTDEEKEEMVRNKYPEVKRLYDEYSFAIELHGGEDL